MPEEEDEINIDELRRSVDSVQNILDETIRTLDEPEVKALLQGYAAALTSAAAGFFVDFPATLAQTQADIAAARETISTKLQQLEHPPTPSVDPEPADAFDPNLGGKLRDEVLERYGLDSIPAPAPAGPPSPETLEPYDFWSTSFSVLSGVTPIPPAKPPTASESKEPIRPASFESWIQRDSGTFPGSER